jgi:hypothetical protein
MIVSVVLLLSFAYTKGMKAVRAPWQERAFLGEYIAELVYNLDKDQCRHISIAHLLSDPFLILETSPHWVKSLTFGQQELFLKVVVQYIKNSYEGEQQKQAVEVLTRSLSSADISSFQTKYLTLEAALKNIEQNLPQEDDEWCILPTSSAEYILESIHPEKAVTSTRSWWNTCSNLFYWKRTDSSYPTWLQSLWTGTGTCDIQKAWSKAFGNFYASLDTQHYYFAAQFLEIFKELHVMLDNPMTATSMKNFIFALAREDVKRFGILCYASLERLCFDVFFKGKMTNHASPTNFQRTFRQDFNGYKLNWPMKLSYARIKDIECLGFLAQVALDNTTYPDIVHKQTAAHMEYHIK